VGLDPDIRQYVIAELPKELTHHKNYELLTHVKYALSYASAA